MSRKKDPFFAEIEAAENIEKDFKRIVGVSIFGDGATVTLPIAAKILRHPYRKILLAAKRKVLISRRIGKSRARFVKGFDLWVYARCHLAREKFS